MPPGSKLLKLKCDKLVSNFALKFNLRRYIKAEAELEELRARAVEHEEAAAAVGADAHPHFSST
jgi:hypothetical protein